MGLLPLILQAPCKAEKQYLEKLLEVAEQEVDNIARCGKDSNMSQRRHC